jgi:hypothetical protein
MRALCFVDCVFIVARDTCPAREQPGTDYFPATVTELPVG